MAKTLQFRRDTTTNLASVTGAVGELFVDTTKDTVVVMDGSTAGGFPLAKESDVPADLSDLTDTTNLIPTSLTDLGITDGTDGQVLTTNGSGSFTFTTATGGGTTFANIDVTDTLTVGSTELTQGTGAETVISNAWGPNDGVWYNSNGDNRVLFFRSSTTEELNTALAALVPGDVFKATTKVNEDFYPGTVVQEVTFTVVSVDPGTEFEPVWVITVTSSVSIDADAELDGTIGITISGTPGLSVNTSVTVNGEFISDSALLGDILVSDNIVSILPTYSTDGYNTEIAQPLVVNGDLEVLGQINKNDAVIRVFGKGTPAENAAELQAAVDRVTLLNANLDTTFTFNNDTYYGVNFEYGLYNTYAQPAPTNGIPTNGLFAKNSSRIPVAIVVSAGFYDFTNLTTDYLDISGNFIGIVSETGQADIMITSGNTHAVQVSGSNGYYSGLNVVGGNNPGIKEFNSPVSASSTFYNCHGGVNSFTIGAGVYIKCSGSNYSFGSTSVTNTNTNASGTFIECSGGSSCFGSSDGSNTVGGSAATGNFVRCQAVSGFASGPFDTASGIFVDCTSDTGGFGGDVSSGTFYRCRGGQSAFGGQIGGTASGRYYNCIALRYSWGMASDSSGTLTGKLYYCVMTPLGGTDTSTFQTVSGSGRTYYSVDAAGNVNNQ